MVNIRSMQLEDVPQVLELENLVVIDPWSASIFRDCILVGYHCFMLEKEGIFAGYALMSIAAEEAHILNIVIHPAFQRQGLGILLMEYLIVDAQQYGSLKILLEVRVSNHIAQALYQKLQFTEIGQRADYYKTESGREDGLVLELKLSE